jgi:hypothetical protein
MADEDEIRRVMFTHWPGLLPIARLEAETYVVHLMRWPPSDEPSTGPLSARSPSGYEAALLDLATFTPVTVRCRDPRCVLCAPR